MGISLRTIPIKYDNKSVIDIAKNLVQYSRTKLIEVHHHFIQDHVKKGNAILEFAPIDLQLADIFTKPLSEDHFNFIHQELEMLDFDA